MKPCRAIAKAVGIISLRAVQRLWDTHRLQPHRLRTFKRSNDPEFAEKVEDVVGLYMDPPLQAIAVSIDEKRAKFGPSTHPTGPANQAWLGRDDDARLRTQRTTTLFAAHNILDGTVIKRCMPKLAIRSSSVQRAVPAGSSSAQPTSGVL
jgi:hypothetical protein